MANGSSQLNDITKITIAKAIIDTLGDTFTKKEYDEARPPKTATIEWLVDNRLITLDHKETFSKSINKTYAHKQRTMVLADGTTLCSEGDWNSYPNAVKNAIIVSNGGVMPTIMMRYPTETITCYRYYYKWNEARAEQKISELIDWALEYAQIELAKLEPKVLKCREIIAIYSDDE